MKSEEIRKASGEELEKNLKDLREEFGNLSFQHSNRPIDLEQGGLELTSPSKS